MKQIAQFIFEKLKLNNQSKLANNIDLKQKIKLALNFDDSVFKEFSSIYNKCFRFIINNIELYSKQTNNAEDIIIITTKTSWDRKIKEFPSCEKYKNLFTIDDNLFVKLYKKYESQLYFYVENPIQLGIIFKDDNNQTLIYFGDESNGKYNFKQFWFIFSN